MKKIVVFLSIIFAFTACARKTNQEKSENEDSVVIVDTIQSTVDTMNVDTVAAPVQ